MLDDESSVGGIQFSSKLYTNAPEPLGNTINFVDNWIQCFSKNDKVRNFIQTEDARVIEGNPLISFY